MWYVNLNVFGMIFVMVDIKAEKKIIARVLDVGNTLILIN